MMSDLSIILIYLGCVLLLAFFSRRKNTDHSVEIEQDIIEGQYLASRSLSMPESLGSIIATEVSALTFLGIPAFSFSSNYSFIHIYLGAIIGRLLIALIIVPRIYNKGLTLYSIMGKAGSTVMGTKVTGLIYCITKLLAVGVRLYAGSILVAEFFNLSIILALVLITGMTFLYTLIGGLKAVVRTDLLQTFLFVGGGIAAHYIIPEIANVSWGELYSMAREGGKTEIINLSNLAPFFIGVSGGVLFDLCTHGVDQDFTQRLMGAKSMKIAQRSIFLSSFFSIAVGILFLSIGALLWSYYQLNPASIPINSDKVFAQFITDHFPSPLKGLMLAGVLAATMSTLDSTINALSSVAWSELLPNRDIKKIKRYMTIDTLLISLLLLAVAIMASYSEGILLLGLKIASWSGGVLAALFFSQLVWQNWTKGELNAPSVLIAYGFNLVGVGINSFLIDGPWQYNVYYGMGFATITLKVFSSKFNKQI